MEHANPFTAELEIKPQPSRLLLSSVISIHIAAFLVVLIVPGIALWLRCLVCLMIAASAIHFLFFWLGYRPEKQVTTLYWREFGGWEIITGTGKQLPVILSDTSYSSLYLSVLNFKTRKALGHHSYCVVLLPDNCSFITRRYLRMRMKLLMFKQIEPSRRKGGSRWM